MYDQQMLAPSRMREDQRSAEQHRLVQALLAQRRVQRQERRAHQALARAGRAARLVAV
jgi:hypothetical protein